MAWEFIVFIVLAIIGPILTVVFVKMDKVVTVRRGYREESEEANESRQAAGLVMIGTWITAALFFFLSTFTVVGTKNIGIQLSFNKPVGTMANGWNWKEPWTKVPEWDGKLQNVNTKVSARIGNGSTADFDISFQYEFTTDAGVMDLFRAYGDEEGFLKNKMLKLLQDAVNQTVADFDPITALQQVAAEERQTPVSMADLSREAQALLSAATPNGTRIVTVLFIKPTYDGPTEDRITKFNAAIQETAIAEQQIKTAQKIQEANDELATTKASDFQQCLAMVERMGANLPPAFNCNQSGGTGVIVNSAR